MDEKKITMATMGGHGFGAKVALATAINNMDRCTGVINLDGGPLDHRFYEAYQELESYVSVAKSIVDRKMDMAAANKTINEHITCKKWASIFKQNLEEKNGLATFLFNVHHLAADMSKK
jgi:pimeloyl-ACP methyl ester carboxylesterase